MTDAIPSSPVPAVHGSTGATRALAEGKLLIDEPAPGVLRLTISNPSKRNALDHPILDAITDTLTELTAAVGSAQAAGAGAVDAAGIRTGPDPVRCLIVTGAHGMFSAGYDIGDIPDDDFESLAERLVAHPFTRAIEALEAYPYPTLAVLPGHTIGGGLELALACDLRIAKDAIKLGMPPAKLGLVYSHTGILRFIEAIGAPRTRELFLVAQNIDASTALAWGLVNRVAPEAELEALSLALATEIAGNAPISQLGNKRVINTMLRNQPALVAEVEQTLLALRRASFGTEDMREGVRAFAQKRAPRWQGR
jgi:enoyl-CoA hydratase/carnithine racemase